VGQLGGYLINIVTRRRIRAAIPHEKLLAVGRRKVSPRSIRRIFCVAKNISVRSCSTGIFNARRARPRPAFDDHHGVLFVHVQNGHCIDGAALIRAAAGFVTSLAPRSTPHRSAESPLMSLHRKQLVIGNVQLPRAARSCVRAFFLPRPVGIPNFTSTRAGSARRKFLATVCCAWAPQLRVIPGTKSPLLLAAARIPLLRPAKHSPRTGRFSVVPRYRHLPSCNAPNSTVVERTIHRRRHVHGKDEPEAPHARQQSTIAAQHKPHRAAAVRLRIQQRDNCGMSAPTNRTKSASPETPAGFRIMKGNK